MICQKQHRQNDLAGQVDVPTREEVHVMGDLWTHVETTVSWTCVGTTDVTTACQKTTQTE